MAEFTGITADKADQILGQSVVSGAINENGHLILTRSNGSTIDAGDFTAIVTSVLETKVNEAYADVEAAIPAYIVGGVVEKGNISGTMSFAEFDRDNIVNVLIKAGLNGNVTINSEDLPDDTRPGTQFAIRFVQDAVGSRTLTLTGFKKSQGVLALTPAPASVDMLVFVYDGTWWYAGLMGVDFK